MVDFFGALKRPFTSPKKLAIGTVLTGVPIVSIVGSFFMAGYGLKSGETASSGDLELPEWTDWKNLFVRGLLGVIISLVYTIPLIIAFVIFSGMPADGTITGNAVSGLADGDPPSTEMMLAMFTALGTAVLLILPLALITFYILPAALLGYATTNSFGAAFSLGTIFKKIFTGNYFIAWLLVVVYSVIMVVISSVVTLMLGGIPFLGNPLTFAFQGAYIFITWVTVYTLFGEGYSK